jgi:chemotaxis protein CheZ
MKMENLPGAAAHLHTQAQVQPQAPASPEVFQQLGLITRQLHDTLAQLGVMPKLQQAADGLPDARSRLGYIAVKTADAANKVLNSVERAKVDHGLISDETRRLAQFLTADPVKAVASGAVMNFVTDVDAATARIDQHLTDIMMAQDFHDLTGQVVAKVVTLVVNPEGRTDVVSNQSEVDDLLASLGF